MCHSDTCCRSAPSPDDRQDRIFHQRKPRNQREATFLNLFDLGVERGQMLRCPVTDLPMPCERCGT